MTIAKLRERREQIAAHRAKVLSRAPINLSKIAMLELLQDDYFWLTDNFAKLLDVAEAAKAYELIDTACASTARDNLRRTLAALEADDDK